MLSLWLNDNLHFVISVFLDYYDISCSLEMDESK